MTIIHDTWGEVEGVEKPCAWFWWKDGARYNESDGWREKVEERWEEVDFSKQLWCEQGWILPDNERLRCVERYALPEDWYQQWRHYPGDGLIPFINQFKKPCLIAERKVES
jgi:hypothetical protein